MAENSVYAKLTPVIVSIVVVFEIFVLAFLFVNEPPTKENMWMFMLITACFIAMPAIIILDAPQYSMTVYDQKIKMNSPVKYKSNRKTLEVNDAREIYMMETQIDKYRKGRIVGEMRVILLSADPIYVSDGLPVAGEDAIAIIYSENFITALKENFNCHFVGEFNA